MHFRSPFLKAFPQKTRIQAGRGLRGRLLRVFLVVGLPLLTLTLLANQVLPKEGPLRFLYLFHDHIYLPMKGWTYTRYFPWSLAWWAVVVLLVLMRVVSYLGSVSLLKAAHQHLVLHLTASPMQRPLLLKTEKMLSPFRPPSQLLIAAASLHRERALHNYLAEHGNADLSGATLFHTSLLEMTEPNTPNWSSLQHIFQAWLTVNRLPQPKSHQTREAQTLLNELARTIAKHLDYHQEDTLKNALAQEPGFHPHSILVDILHLISLHQPEMAGHLMDPDTAAKPQLLQKKVFQRLHRSYNARLHILHRSRRHFEAQIMGRVLDKPVPLLDQPPSAQSLKTLGFLAMDLALELARRNTSGPTAESYLDALDALNLTAELASGEKPLQRREEPAIMAQLQALFKGLPAPQHYRLCAETAAVRIRERERQWRDSGLGPSQDGPIHAEDFQLEQHRVQDLLLAAGPHLDQLGETP